MDADRNGPYARLRLRYLTGLPHILVNATVGLATEKCGKSCMTADPKSANRSTCATPSDLAEADLAAMIELTIGLQCRGRY